MKIVKFVLGKAIAFRNVVLYDKVGRFLRTKFRNRSERRKLTNSNFTILSQNCIGSIWYHDLGERFCSPTINMKFEANSFVRFLKNIHHYLDAPISFVESEKPYPVGYIGNDVFVEFVHYHSEEDVLQKWNERKSRINWDNLCVLACDKDMSEQSIIDFANLTQFKNKILFTTPPHLLNNFNNLTQVIQPFWPDGADARLLNFCSITGKRYYNRLIDYVDYLNSIE